jgi:hypothetical protein
MDVNSVTPHLGERAKDHFEITDVVLGPF